MRKVFSYLYRLLFSIPPLEHRQPKCFILNQFAVPGYDPKSVESYILYKSFMFAVWMFVVATALYALPFILQGTTWAGFHILPDFYNNLPHRPVDYYKYSFPQAVSLPLIAATCIYAVVLSYATRDQHDWHFSSTRPLYAENMAKLRAKWFGFTRLALLHLAFPTGMAIAVYFLWSIPEFWNSYILLTAIHDFSTQTLGNFAVIVALYLWILPAFAEMIFAGFLLLLFEKIHSRNTVLRPLFKKGNNYDQSRNP